MRSLLVRTAQEWSPFAATLLLYAGAHWLTKGWGLLSYVIAVALAGAGYAYARRAKWS